jgi:hypothetical protein
MKSRQRITHKSTLKRSLKKSRKGNSLSKLHGFKRKLNSREKKIVKQGLTRGGAWGRTKIQLKHIFVKGFRILHLPHL